MKNDDKRCARRLSAAKWVESGIKVGVKLNMPNNFAVSAKKVNFAN